MHKQQNTRSQVEHPGPADLPYEKPEIRRIDLALEETLSAGCKLVDVCDDTFDPESGAPGS